MKNKLLILLAIFTFASCSSLKMFSKDEPVVAVAPIESIKLSPEETFKERLVILIKNFEPSTNKMPASFDSKSEDSRNSFTYQINKTLNPTKRIIASIRIVNLKVGNPYYVINIEIQTKNPDSIEKLEIKSASKDNAIDQIKNILND